MNNESIRNAATWALRAVAFDEKNRYQEAIDSYEQACRFCEEALRGHLEPDAQKAVEDKSAEYLHRIEVLKNFVTTNSGKRTSFLDVNNVEYSDGEEETTTDRIVQTVLHTVDSVKVSPTLYYVRGATEILFNFVLSFDRQLQLSSSILSLARRWLSNFRPPLPPSSARKPPPINVKPTTVVNAIPSAPPLPSPTESSQSSFSLHETTPATATPSNYSPAAVFATAAAVASSPVVPLSTGVGGRLHSQK